MKNTFLSKCKVLIPALILSAGYADAQDARLSQYDRTPMLINPAFTGHVTKTYRIGGLLSFQNTKNASLIHKTLYADRKFEGKKGNWGVGASYYSYGQKDFCISSGFYSLSGSRHFALDKQKQHWLSVGAQVTAASGKADPSKAKFDSLLTGGGMTFKMSPGEVDASRNYIDMNMGVMYVYKGENFSSESGVGVYHINRPKHTLNPNQTAELLRRRVTITNNIGFSISDQKRLHFKTMFYREGMNLIGSAEDVRTAQPVYKDYIYSVSLETGLKKDVAVTTGLSTRNSGTIAPQVGINTKAGLQIFVSYEATLEKTFVYGAPSKLKRAELSVGYSF